MSKEMKREKKNCETGKTYRTLIIPYERPTLFCNIIKKKKERKLQE